MTTAAFTRTAWVLVGAAVAASLLDVATYLQMLGCAGCVELNPVPLAMGPTLSIVLKVVVTGYVVYAARMMRTPHARRLILYLAIAAWSLGAATNLAALGVL